MKCSSCSEIISPKFAHAISANACPYCGNEIMKEELKNIFVNLKILMNDAEPYMDEVEDWFYTNYSLKKVVPGEEKLSNSMDFIAQAKAKMANKSSPLAVNRSSDDDDSESSDSDSSSPTTIFAQRAGVKAHKNAIDYIKGRSVGAAHPSEFVGEDEEYGEMSNEDEPPLNAREANQLSSLFEDGPKSKSQNELDIENLKRVRNQIAGKGTFRRD